MKDPDILLAIKPVINAFNQLSIPYYIFSDRVSERQWLDVVGVIKVQGNSLNTDYLVHWSKTLDLFDLLKQAFLDAGVNC